MKPIAIGIAGTAKNTGKTTTTAALLCALEKRRVKLGLTSIGYDGEMIDNITGLPKPRLYLAAGVLVAVAEKCLAASSARIEVLKKTECRTPLGRVVIGQVVQPGLLVIAGPNKTKELQWVLHELVRFGSQLIMVDGALNRLAPMVATHAFILATGASRQPNISRLAFETGSIYRICLVREVKNIDGPCLSLNSVLNIPQVEQLVENIEPRTKYIVIKGLMAEKCWGYLVEQNPPTLRGLTLVFNDPVKIMLSGNVGNVYRKMETLQQRGVFLAVRKGLPLIAVTANPFYPRYRYEAADYEPAYVESKSLLGALRKAVGVPVYDVVSEGVESLVDRILGLSFSPCP